MIVVRVTGGLGNQMFQYACGRALAEKKGTELLLDLSAYRTYQLHNYGLDAFQCKIIQAPRYLTTGSHVWSALRRARFRPEHYLRLLGIRWLGEGGDLRYRPQTLDAQGSAYLDGYWQSEKYFDNCEEIIQNDFSLRPPLLELFQVRRRELGIGLRVTVSIHVRRGDYVAKKLANATHGVLGKDYYQRATKHMLDHLGCDLNLLVFSDDIEWARSNLRLPVPTTYVDASDNFPQLDLHLMASCDHHIIANSSFSWWGAWLNRSPGRMVVAPKQWFRSARHCANDICPSEWVML